MNVDVAGDHKLAFVQSKNFHKRSKLVEECVGKSSHSMMVDMVIKNEAFIFLLG